MIIDKSRARVSSNLRKKLPTNRMVEMARTSAETTIIIETTETVVRITMKTVVSSVVMVVIAVTVVAAGTTGVVKIEMLNHLSTTKRRRRAG